MSDHNETDESTFGTPPGASAVGMAPVSGSSGRAAEGFQDEASIRAGQKTLRKKITNTMRRAVSGEKLPYTEEDCNIWLSMLIKYDECLGEEEEISPHYAKIRRIREHIQECAAEAAAASIHSPFQSVSIRANHPPTSQSQSTPGVQYFNNDPQTVPNNNAIQMTAASIIHPVPTRSSVLPNFIGGFSAPSISTAPLNSMSDLNYVDASTSGQQMSAPSSGMTSVSRSSSGASRNFRSDESMMAEREELRRKILRIAGNVSAKKTITCTLVDCDEWCDALNDYDDYLGEKVSSPHYAQLVRIQAYIRKCNAERTDASNPIQLSSVPISGTNFPPSRGTSVLGVRNWNYVPQSLPNNNTIQTTAASVINPVTMRSSAWPNLINEVSTTNQSAAASASLSIPVSMTTPAINDNSRVSVANTPQHVPKPVATINPLLTIPDDDAALENLPGLFVTNHQVSKPGTTINTSSTIINDGVSPIKLPPIEGVTCLGLCSDLAQVKLDPISEVEKAEDQVKKECRDAYDATLQNDGLRKRYSVGMPWLSQKHLEPNLSAARGFAFHVKNSLPKQGQFKAYTDVLMDGVKNNYAPPLPYPFPLDGYSLLHFPVRENNSITTIRPVSFPVMLHPVLLILFRRRAPNSAYVIHVMSTNDGWWHNRTIKVKFKYFSPWSTLSRGRMWRDGASRASTAVSHNEQTCGQFIYTIVATPVIACMAD